MLLATCTLVCVYLCVHACVCVTLKQQNTHCVTSCITNYTTKIEPCLATPKAHTVRSWSYAIPAHFRAKQMTQFALIPNLAV